MVAVAVALRGAIAHDSKYLYVIRGGAEPALGREDGRIVAPLVPGDALHLREGALSYLGEKRVLFYRMTPDDAGVVGPIELLTRDATIVVPNPGDPEHPETRDVIEHVWRVPIVVVGSTDCDVDFMIADRACTSLAHFTWRVRIEARGDESS